MFLLVASGAIAWEAVQRFSGPPAVAASTISLVAAVGIVVNGISALLFLQGSRGDLNLRGAYLHMAADAAVSLGVVISGLTIMVTGWYWLDPAVSLVIVLVIVAGTWRLLRESFSLSLNAVPKHIDAPAVEAWLKQRAGVTSLHDLHIWGISTTESALTVHFGDAGKLSPRRHSWTASCARSKIGFRSSTARCRWSRERPTMFARCTRPRADAVLLL